MDLSHINFFDLEME